MVCQLFSQEVGGIEIVNVLGNLDGGFPACYTYRLFACLVGYVQTAAFPATPHHVLQNVRIIGEITQYIEENLEKDLTLNTIAQQFHFNPSYLSSLFKRQTGTGAERIYDPETDRTG